MYVMALAQQQVTATVARRAIADLITNEMELPPVALVLARCREAAASDDFYDWRCPSCGSTLVAGSIGGPGICFDCTWEGRFA